MTIKELFIYLLLLETAGYYYIKGKRRRMSEKRETQNNSWNQLYTVFQKTVSNGPLNLVNGKSDARKTSKCHV